MKIDFKRNHTNGCTFWKQCAVEEKIDEEIYLRYFFNHSEAEKNMTEYVLLYLKW